MTIPTIETRASEVATDLLRQFAGHSFTRETVEIAIGLAYVTGRRDECKAALEREWDAVAAQRVGS